MFSNIGGGGRSSQILNKIQLLKSILCAAERKDVSPLGPHSPGAGSSAKEAGRARCPETLPTWACCVLLGTPVSRRVNPKLVMQPGVGSIRVCIQIPALPTPPSLPEATSTGAGSHHCPILGKTALRALGFETREPRVNRRCSAQPCAGAHRLSQGGPACRYTTLRLLLLPGLPTRNQHASLQTEESYICLQNQGVCRG